MTFWSLGRLKEAVDHLRQAAEQLDETNDPANAEASRDSIREIEATGRGRRRFTGWRRR